MRYLILLFITLFFIHCKNEPIENEIPPQIIKGALGQKLDSLFSPYTEEIRALTNNTAGLAVGITNRKEVIFAKTFGFADVANQVPVDLNTRFHIASVSKPFSAFAVAKLIQDGKLNLDDTVVQIIPEFKMEDERYKAITIQHLLNHTSGIPRNIAPDDWLNPSFGPKALEENLAILEPLSLDFEPGSQYSYSNSAFDLLGLLISRASGAAFHEYIHQNILLPAGMNNSSFEKTVDSIPSNWADAHSFGLSSQQLTPYPYNERLFPSSGMVASVLDMCKWGMLHLNEGSIQGTQVLKKEHFQTIVSPSFDTPWGDQIGLSWFLQSYLDRPIIMHTGYDTGFEAIMYIYPEHDISITVLANQDFARTARLINAASEIIFDQQPKNYTISAKYPFAEAYQKGGNELAKSKWETLQKDTTDIYIADKDDLLTTGAILENGKQWHASKEILEYYLTFNKQSTYAWRLLGNDYLMLGDTAQAKRCYQRTLDINPNYTKGRIALDKLQ